jgi:hypothetical protein
VFGHNTPAQRKHEKRLANVNCFTLVASEPERSERSVAVKAAALRVECVACRIVTEHSSRYDR